MLALISPAKTLVPGPPRPDLPATRPFFADDAATLAEILRGFSPQALARLLGISPALADLNAQRFRAFAPDPAPKAARQAALLYRGDTYKGLDADTLTPEDWAFAQEHLAILSGLYGLLRPCDAIQPYRLEMSTPLPNPAGKDLYPFWGARIAQRIDQLAAHDPHPCVVNLASEEYIRAVPETVTPRITPVFQEMRQGKPRVIGLLAKKARGAMARFLVAKRLRDPRELLAFQEEGYRFRPELSHEARWVFLRE